MKKIYLIYSLIIAVYLVVILGKTTPIEAKGYGKVIGKFVFKGEIPKIKNIVKKGNPLVKDAKVCTAKDINSEVLEIDPKTKGIKNMVIYINKMKAKYIHPKLAKSKNPLVDFDQIGCKFTPHILFVRTDQQVRVLSQDNCNHNCRIGPIKNAGKNFLVGPKDRVGTKVKMPLRESVPIPVQCDIHTWMHAKWMILDHPYCAITKADGTFEIDLVPEGKQKFRVWHEMRGYVKAGKKGTSTGFSAKIKDGKTFDLGKIELTIDDLQEKK